MTHKSGQKHLVCDGVWFISSVRSQMPTQEQNDKNNMSAIVLLYCVWLNPQS